MSEEGLVRLPDPAAVAVRTAGRHSTEILQAWVGRFPDPFDTEFREWIASIEAGTEPTGPSAWDGYAATVISNATVEALKSGRIVETGMKPRRAFYGGTD